MDKQHLKDKRYLKNKQHMKNKQHLKDNRQADNQPLVRRLLPWGPVLLWMIVIFMFSSDNMEQSAQKSNALFSFLESLFFEDGIAPDDGGNLRFLVRKLGHFSEFFVLGGLFLMRGFPVLFGLAEGVTRKKSFGGAPSFARFMRLQMNYINCLSQVGSQALSMSELIRLERFLVLWCCW